MKTTFSCPPRPLTPLLSGQPLVYSCKTFYAQTIFLQGLFAFYPAVHLAYFTLTIFLNMLWWFFVPTTFFF